MRAAPPTALQTGDPADLHAVAPSGDREQRHSALRKTPASPKKKPPAGRLDAVRRDAGSPRAQTQRGRIGPLPDAAAWSWRGMVRPTAAWWSCLHARASAGLALPVPLATLNEASAPLARTVRSRGLHREFRTTHLGWTVERCSGVGASYDSLPRAARLRHQRVQHDTCDELPPFKRGCHVFERLREQQWADA